MSFKTFRGGTYPPEYKEETEGKSIEETPLPEEVIIPFHQHTGAPCSSLVEKGDKVKVGQKIGESKAFVSAPIHSSVSGEVKAVEPRLHFTGEKVLSVVIVPDGDQEQVEFEGLSSKEKLSPNEVRKATREAGIVGLGGAAFPTHVKLSPPKDKTIDSVIINGCECEPYLTLDHRLMLEQPDQLIDGLKIIMKTVGARRGYFGIELNKRDAISRIGEKVSKERDVEIVPLKTKYPQGAEKQLIKVILGREVPSGGLPFDVGAYVQNVGTTIAISQAVRKGIPLYSRVITVSGKVATPKNLRVRIGTPVKFLIDFCGGFEGEPGKVIVGGPMTGFAQFSLDIPVVKGTSGIVVLNKAEAEVEKPQPCIKCGSCVEVCPMHLMPLRLKDFAMVELWDSLQEYGILDCIECGCCAYICPARIPLVQWIRLGKAKVQQIKIKKQER